MAKKLTVRVFYGGEDASQRTSFLGAVRELLQVEDNFTVKTLTICNSKDKNMTPKTLVDWLLDCDIHMIISHLHQGLSNKDELQMGWNMKELYAEVRRLANHPGYPSGIKLQCPVFTQNKYNYLKAIPSFVNPTLCIPIWYTNAPYPQNNATHDEISQ